MPEIVCIACPIGCRMRVEADGEKVSVSGNRCPKGEAYGREELLSPSRVLTAVVRTDCARFPFAPVRTDSPLPRGMASGLMESLAGRVVRLPVRCGGMFLQDYGGSGVNVVFSRSLPPDEIPPVG